MTNKLPYDAVLWGKQPGGMDVILSELPENILQALPMARRDGWIDLRIVIYDNLDTHGWEELDKFVGEL